MRHLTHVIATDRPLGWLVAASKHRRRRVAKKYTTALIVRTADRGDPKVALAVVDNLRQLRAARLIPTERCERRLCCHLRRSGLRVGVRPRR